MPQALSLNTAAGEWTEGGKMLTPNIAMPNSPSWMIKHKSHTKKVSDMVWLIWCCTNPV